MTAYYNEFDPYAAQWLRNLIAAGLEQVRSFGPNGGVEKGQGLITEGGYQ